MKIFMKKGEKINEENKVQNAKIQSCKKSVILFNTNFCIFKRFSLEVDVIRLKRRKEFPIDGGFGLM